MATYADYISMEIGKSFVNRKNLMLHHTTIFANISKKFFFFIKSQQSSSKFFHLHIFQVKRKGKVSTKSQVIKETMPYDRTCDSTEEWKFFNYHRDILKSPEVIWHFDKEELHAVALIYFKLQLDADCDIKQELPSQSLSMVLHNAFGMADDTLMQRIFTAIDQITNSVSLRAWISALSIFLRGSLEERIEFCFKVYDVTGKSELRRETLVQLLRKCLYKHHEEDIEEAAKDLADIIIKELDVDHDGIISFEDFKDAILKEPMMLECLGQCLPDRKHVYAFLLTFTDKIKDF